MTSSNDVVVHPAKLPATVAMDDLLVRPGDGITVQADPARAGWRYLSFRALALAAEERVPIALPDQESIVLTIAGGGVRVDLPGRQALALPGRRSVFEGLPWAAYLPAGSDARLIGLPDEPGGRAIVAYAQAPLTGRSGVSKEPILIRPEDVDVEIRGAGQATRQVNNIVMPGFPADRLLCCEVFTPGGNWSGWPPHRHDVDAMPAEAVLEETYYYQMRRPEGWGLARLYHRDGRSDHTWAVKNGDLLLVTEGYHPFAANPGYDGYYLNFLAGDRRTMQASDDPDLAWVRDSWPATPKDLRLPLPAHRRR